jgi:hypothetical protein
MTGKKARDDIGPAASRRANCKPQTFTAVKCGHLVFGSGQLAWNDDHQKNEQPWHDGHSPYGSISLASTRSTLQTPPINLNSCHSMGRMPTNIVSEPFAASLITINQPHDGADHEANRRNGYFLNFCFSQSVIILPISSSGRPGVAPI